MVRNVAAGLRVLIALAAVGCAQGETEVDVGTARRAIGPERWPPQLLIRNTTDVTIVVKSTVVFTTAGGKRDGFESTTDPIAPHTAVYALKPTAPTDASNVQIFIGAQDVKGIIRLRLSVGRTQEGVDARTRAQFLFNEVVVSVPGVAA
jgi:hypothetical protein